MVLMWGAHNGPWLYISNPLLSSPHSKIYLVYFAVGNGFMIVTIYAFVERRIDAILKQRKINQKN